MLENYKSVYYLHFDTLDSTILWTRENAHTLDPRQITCVTALEQTAGKGRLSRKWFSPRGQNIYATLYFCLPLECPFLSNLAQLLSLSCCALLQEKGFKPQIKWPNDILLDEKKVAGCLCETLSVQGLTGIILSIGLNVNMSQELLNLIDQPATSLAQLSGHLWSLEQLLEPLVQQFLKDLQTVQKKGFSHFVPILNSVLAYKGHKISCNHGNSRVQGICHSIDPRGMLNLQLEDGQILKISSGEIALKT